MKSAVKEKIDNDARRKVGKLYGFKQSSWCNWLIKDGYFFFIMHGTFTKDADLYVKPCYYDDILWRLSPGEDFGKRPQSLRAIGDFTAPEFPVSKNYVPLEKDADFTEENCTSVWHAVFKKVLSQIDEFLMRNPEVEEFTFIDNDSIGKFDDSLARMLEMIYHKQYQEAGDLAEELVKCGKKGSYGWEDRNGNYKYLNEYIVDFCHSRKDG